MQAISCIALPTCSLSPSSPCSTNTSNNENSNGYRYNSILYMTKCKIHAKNYHNYSHFSP